MSAGCSIARIEGQASHLAQVNIGIPRAPLDAPALRGFVEALDPVNAVADASPGFVWRLQTGDGDATAIRAFGDDRIIVNMSVWESLEDLRSFVYTTHQHREVLARRREWFDSMAEAYLALWWVPAGHLPSVAEAEERVAHLRAHGPTPRAFTFRRHFPPAGRVGSRSGRRRPPPLPQRLRRDPRPEGLTPDPPEW